MENSNLIAVRCHIGTDQNKMPLLLQKLPYLLSFPVSVSIATVTSTSLKMLFAEGLYDALLHTHRICDFFGSLPFKWSKGRLSLKAPFFLNIYMLRLCLSFGYMVCALFQVAASLQEANAVVMAHTVMFVSDYLLNFTTHVTNYTCRDDIVKFFNAMLVYEKKRNPANLQSHSLAERRITKGLMAVFTGTGLFIPLLYHIESFRHPCYPMVVGYFMVDQCKGPIGTTQESTGEWSALQMKVWITLLSYLNWSFLLFGNCFHMAVEMVMVGHCFRSYIRLYGR